MAKYFLLSLFCLSKLSVTNAQIKKFTIPDSLINKTYEELNKSFTSNYYDTLRCKVYLNTILSKSIKEKNYHYQARAYCNLSYYEELESDKLRLIDKSIEVSHNLNDKSYLLLPYSFKGFYYYNKSLYASALESYLKMLEIAEEVNSLNYIDIAKHNIGLLKTEIGKHEEALPLLRESFIYEKQRKEMDTSSYLESMLSLAKSYTYNKILDSATIYNRKGVIYSKRSYPRTYEPFIFNEGINLFYKNKIYESSDSINKALSLMDIKNPQQTNLFVIGEFYRGKIQEKLANENSALSHYLKLDTLVQKNQLFLAEVRDGYEFVINSYDRLKKRDKQLEYINKLLHFDSIVYSQRNYLTNKLFKEFDKPRLLREKELIINELNSNTKNTKVLLWLSISFSLITLFMFYFQYQKRKLLKIRFNKLLKPAIPVVNEKTPNSSKLELDISKKIVDKILSGLENFENNCEYKKVNITSNLLAKELKTNSKYLTRVIKHYKDKNFTTYLNDLRISYITERLKKEEKLQNYTIKAIAKEAGFNSAEAFSRYFYKKTGIYPSYFIKNIQKTKNQFVIV
ncbi:AraC family transcriptional regulator [uncultured Aquimarina sp.]|uniref:AraC family transcriptional regulator n=1 Tax=uncultured Aquimarina sp. TaxID=575652 RepID=UPI002614C759|nr:AraC family transcriptional regulator [uncultured Aquimarina sp.]